MCCIHVLLYFYSGRGTSVQVFHVSLFLISRCTVTERLLTKLTQHFQKPMIALDMCECAGRDVHTYLLLALR